MTFEVLAILCAIEVGMISTIVALVPIAEVAFLVHRPVAIGIRE